MFNLKDFLQSFKYAFRGLKNALQKEQSLRIQILIGILVLFFSLWIGLSGIEMALITGMISIVISLELINTTAEKIIDVVNLKKHPKIRFIKDVMAAGVLVSALGALIVGLIIFLPRFF